MTPDANGYLSHRQILVVLGGLMTGMFLAALDQSIVGTALPRITSRPRRPRQAVVGRHGLPADLDRVDAAVGQDLRPLRPSADLPGAIVIFLIGSLMCGSRQNIASSSPSARSRASAAAA